MNYIEEAMKTKNTDTEGIRKRMNSNKIVDLLHSFIGLSTESNELLTALKANLIYGKELDMNNIYEELGDCMWFIALACDTLGISFEDIQAMNIRKLKARYSDKFKSLDALARDLQREKDALLNEKEKKLNELKDKVKKHGLSIESII